MHLPQNRTIGFDPQPYAFVYSLLLSYMQPPMARGTPPPQLHFSWDGYVGMKPLVEMCRGFSSTKCCELHPLSRKTMHVSSQPETVHEIQVETKQTQGGHADFSGWVPKLHLPGIDAARKDGPRCFLTGTSHKWRVSFLLPKLRIFRLRCSRPLGQAGVAVNTNKQNQRAVFRGTMALVSHFHLHYR